MANFSDLSLLLDEHLYSIADQLPTIVWENTSHTSEEDEPYIEPFVQPAESQNVFLGSYTPTYEHGNYQVNVVGVRYQGRDEVYAWVDKIVSHFPKGTVLTNSGVDINVRIRKAFPRPAFYNSNGRFVVPVDIRYLCYMPVT